MPNLIMEAPMHTPGLARDRISHQEYLEMELTSPVKHEYSAGYVYAMTGTSAGHNIITGNIVDPTFRTII